jgi:hypothetical protein
MAFKIKNKSIIKLGNKQYLPFVIQSELLMNKEDSISYRSGKKKLEKEGFIIQEETYNEGALGGLGSGYYTLKILVPINKIPLFQKMRTEVTKE